jgi:hypothetical protein
MYYINESISLWGRFQGLVEIHPVRRQEVIADNVFIPQAEEEEMFMNIGRINALSFYKPP